MLMKRMPLVQVSSGNKSLGKNVSPHKGCTGEAMSVVKSVEKLKHSTLSNSKLERYLYLQTE